MPPLVLGIDSSTQSVTAVAADIESRARVCEISVDYRAEPDLAAYGITEQYVLPPGEPGEAKQPAVMYFASLDLLFEKLAGELRRLGFSPGDIAAINVSGQQHGHVLLAPAAKSAFDSLQRGKNIESGLAVLLAGSLALPFARIWRTSNTGREAELVRRKVGGKEAIIRLTGSDAPLRFSAFGIRRTALEHPAEYRNTAVIHQISTLIPAVLAGKLDIPLDWGNACGSSLMDYRARQWSDSLLAAVAGDLPGGAAGLEAKLPPLASALTPAGRIAGYFVQRWGLDPGCRVGIGSGDNPQTKCLVNGSLLSLGTSFVIMVETDGETFDLAGYANAMYDSIDRPFTFGCRTNGALRWDGVRSLYGQAKKDYAAAEAALAATPCGNRGRLFVWQAEAESFPVSPAFEPKRVGYDRADFAADYAGIVESTLASVYLNSRHFMAPADTLFVTGGPAASRQVLRRVAAVFKRRVIPLEAGGAALGSAASAACMWLRERGETVDPGEFCASFLQRKAPVEPAREDVRACHGENGCLAAYASLESAFTGS